MRGVVLLGPHQGMPESEACTPCGTIAASDSKLDQMSDDQSTAPCRAPPAHTPRVSTSGGWPS